MIKRGVAVLFFSVLFGMSCEQRAGSHLTPEALAPVLADLHMADAYSGMLRDSARANIGKNYDSLAIWTKSILAKHKISQETFTRSMDWYRDRPQELDSLYARVIPLLEAQRK